MALPLSKPSGGYLRLNYSGPSGVVGVGLQSWDLTAIPKDVRSKPWFKRSLLIFARGLTSGLTDVNAAVAFSPAVGTPTELVLTVSSVAAVDQISLDVWCLHTVVGALSDESKLYFILSAGAIPAPAAVAPPDVAQVSDVGTSNDYAHGDHTHGHGAQPLGDGTNHAVATTTFAGFLSALDKQKLDALSTARWAWFPAETNALNASHRVRNIGASGNFDFDFIVPYDFTTLLGIEMWGASRTCTNAAASLTATGSYGVPPAVPEDVQVAVGLVEAFVAGELFTYSIAGAFGGLSAGAQPAVNIQHNGIGGSIDYYGIFMAYE